MTDAGTTDGYGNPTARRLELDVVRAVYDAFARRDVEAALAYIAPDAEFHLAGTAERVERTEPYRGHDGVRQYFADASRVWHDLRITADDVRVVADAVVAFGHVEATVDGRPMRIAAMWTWQLRDGLAVSVRVHPLG